MNKTDIIRLLKQEIDQLKQFTEGFELNNSIDELELELFNRKIENLQKEVKLLYKYSQAETNQNIPEERAQTTSVKTLQAELNENNIANEAGNKEIHPPIKNKTAKDQAESMSPSMDAASKVPEKKPIETESQIRSSEAKSPIIEHPNTAPETEEKPANKEVEKAIPKKKKKDSQILGEKLGSKKRSVHDLISQNNFEKDLGSQFKTRAVQDIRKAITLNDRIWFQRELFENNNQRYEKTIDHLNSLSNLDDAALYLQKEFNWDADEHVVQKFLKTISRKYI